MCSKHSRTTQERHRTRPVWPEYDVHRSPDKVRVMAHRFEAPTAIMINFQTSISDFSKHRQYCLLTKEMLTRHTCSGWQKVISGILLPEWVLVNEAAQLWIGEAEVPESLPSSCSQRWSCPLVPRAVPALCALCYQPWLTNGWQMRLAGWREEHSAI